MSQTETDGSGLSASRGLCPEQGGLRGHRPRTALRLACSKSGPTPGGKDKRVSGTAGNICSARAVDPRLCGVANPPRGGHRKGVPPVGGVGSDPTATTTACAVLMHSRQRGSGWGGVRGCTGFPRPCPGEPSGLGEGTGGERLPCGSSRGLGKGLPPTLIPRGSRWAGRGRRQQQLVLPASRSPAVAVVRSRDGNEWQSPACCRRLPLSLPSGPFQRLLPQTLCLEPALEA